MRPKIIIVDDQKLVRDGLRDVLARSGDFNVLPAAASGSELLDRLSTDHPDLILMDIRMPGLNGIETVSEMRKRKIDIPVVFLTLFNEPELVFDALSFNVAGFLLKEVSTEHLVHALHTALGGGVVLDPDVARQITTARQKSTDRQDSVELTAREIDVLQLLSNGLDNKEIAKDLGLSAGTVRNHISAILQKLTVTNRTQAVLQAMKLNLISTE